MDLWFTLRCWLHRQGAWLLFYMVSGQHLCWVSGNERTLQIGGITTAIKELWLLNQMVRKFWYMAPKFLDTLPIKPRVYMPPLVSWWPSDNNWLMEFSGSDPIWPLRPDHKRRCSFHFVCRLMLGALSHYIRNLTALRLPYCEEAKPHGEKMHAHSSLQ